MRAGCPVAHGLERDTKKRMGHMVNRKESRRPQLGYSYTLNFAVVFVANGEKNRDCVAILGLN